MFLILEGYSFSRWTQQGDFSEQFNSNYNLLLPCKNHKSIPQFLQSASKSEHGDECFMC